jgi:alanine racemase
MNRGYTSHEIANIVGGQCMGQQDVLINDFEIDSRRIHWGSRTLFIAIHSNRNDGHSFVADAKARGVKCALVQRILNIPGLTQILVDDSTVALQKLAAHHRSTFDIPILAITGSNGKTIVKEWLNQLCAGHFRICRSPRSYNSQLGVPLSVLQMNESHTLAIIEAGISQTNEMNKLHAVIQPTCGIFTHLGEAHLHGFKNQNELFSEKEKLFEGANWVVAANEIKLRSHQNNYLSWGHNGDNHWNVSVEAQREGAVVLKVNGDAFRLPFDTPFLIENASNAICAAIQLGVPIEEIQNKVERWSALEMRMEQLEGVQNTVLYNDAYSFDIPSLKLAIEEIHRHPKVQNRILILSELPEGSNTDEDYKRAVEIIDAYNWECVFLVGAQWLNWKNQLAFNSLNANSTKELLQQLNQYPWKSQVVLVKGARSFEFEQVIQRLQARNHITCLEINLNAIRSNLNFYRDKLNPGVKTMVMVKAFGYGAGSVEIAEWLAFNRVDYLGVAYVDEGVALREGGISLPIMVMNPEEFSVRALMQYNLEPEIYSLRVLTHLLEQKDALEMSASIRIHIKVDTGMRRLGFDFNELVKALEILRQRKDIEVVSVMSHLASAEDLASDAYTNKQLQSFDAFVQQVQVIFPNAWAHISNTSGIARWPQAQYDMVRLGIGLYGYSPVAIDQQYLQNVHRWKTHISQIRNIESGDCVGYGCTFEATKGMRIATLPVGYADGLKRLLSNGKGQVEIAGQLAPIVGRVCMDMTMVDVSQIHCEEGDEVLLIGGRITLKKIAEECSTIPYEILTSISNRVKRKFIKE